MFSSQLIHITLVLFYLEFTLKLFLSHAMFTNLGFKKCYICLVAMKGCVVDNQV